MEAKWWWVVGIVILALSLVGMSQLVGGDAPPAEDMPNDGLSWEGQEPEVPPQHEQQGASQENFFEILYRRDVREPNQWFVRFQHRVPDDWPGAIKSLTDCWIIVRGIDVPLSGVDISFPEAQNNLRRQRNQKAVDFVWEILSRTDFLWAANAEFDHVNEALVVDVFYRRAGVVMDMSQVMIERGHALPTVDRYYYDWGLTVPYLREDQ